MRVEHQHSKNLSGCDDRANSLNKGEKERGGIVEIVPALLQLQKISLEITRPPEDGNKRMRKKRGRGGRERELLKEEETWKGGLHPAR